MRAYRIAYDGQPYHGFQRQPDVPTVEDELFESLRALDVIEESPPPGYAAAGRTDAGVSALAQTVAFETPEWLSPSALNSRLPDDIRAYAQANAPSDFHATHHASEREYTYFLHADGVREALARETLTRLAGSHDFHNLTPDDTGTERDLATNIESDGEFLRLQFRASGFPRQLVRRAVSVVIEVGRTQRPLSDVDRLLSAESLTGPEGIGPAPAAPLVLTAVSYPDLQFRTDEEAVTQTAELFEQVRIERAARSRIAGVLASVGDEHTKRG